MCILLKASAILRSLIAWKLRISLKIYRIDKSVEHTNCKIVFFFQSINCFAQHCSFCPLWELYLRKRKKNRLQIHPATRVSPHQLSKICTCSTITVDVIFSTMACTEVLSFHSIFLFVFDSFSQCSLDSMQLFCIHTFTKSNSWANCKLKSICVTPMPLKLI